MDPGGRTAEGRHERRNFVSASYHAPRWTSAQALFDTGVREPPG